MNDIYVGLVDVLKESSLAATVGIGRFGGAFQCPSYVGLAISENQ